MTLIGPAGVLSVRYLFSLLLLRRKPNPLGAVRCDNLQGKRPSLSSGPHAGPEGHATTEERLHWLTRPFAPFRWWHPTPLACIPGPWPMVGVQYVKVGTKLSDEYKYGSAQLSCSRNVSWHHSLSGHSFARTFFSTWGLQSP